MTCSFGNLTGQPFRIDVVEDLDGYIAGAIVVDQQLDYETAISHSLFVTVSDGQREYCRSKKPKNQLAFFFSM